MAPGRLLAVVLLAAGCAGGRVVVPVTLEPAALPRAVAVEAFTTHEAAVQGIAAILVRDLGLPVPDELTLYVYGSREFFEQGLVSDGRVSPLRAAELSDFAAGVGRRRQLLLQDDAALPADREWIRLLAHELTHVAQIELAQGEGRAEQWLAEGMAEWVAFGVLERLGLDTRARRRETAAAAVSTHEALVSARLDLETLGSPRGFTIRHLREGSLPTYQLAFLMADYLIGRMGLPRVVEYFRLFATRQDRRQNFSDAFGQSFEDFEREILAHLATTDP